jgi:hypothetical protein
MLEFFRRHKGAFLITLTVIIIISFSVWGGWKEDTRAEGAREDDLAFTIYGKDYNNLDVKRLQNQMQLMQMLQLFELGQGLMTLAQQPETRGGDFIFNSLVLRHEMDKLGIHPSDADAKAALEKLPSLQENGKFSVQRAQMAEARMGMYGMTGQDMLDIMKLDIGFKKLQELLGKNYVPSSIEIEKAYASRYQTLKISTIDFALADFKKAAQVTDAEIQKYYDENKDGYKTPEKRSVSYIFFEDPKEDDKRPAEETQKLKTAVVDRVNKFDEAIIKPNAKFADAAKDLKETVLKLPAFSRDAPPDAIKEEAELIDAIFIFNKEGHAASTPIKGSKGYFIFTVDQIDEPKQQELAAVKDKIKETLVAQKGQEALGKAVNDARTALQDGLKAGKKIEDLVKEKKLTLSPQTELTVAEPPPTLANANQIANEAKNIAPGQVTSVIDTETGATLVYVHAKELRKRDDSVALRKSVEDSTARSERMRIFSAWFTKKREEAKLKLSEAAKSDQQA